MKKLIELFFNQTSKGSLLVLTFIFMAGTFQSCKDGNSKEVLTIGENGNLHYIIVPDHSDQVIKFAASELKVYLKKITGQDLQIMESADKNNRKGTIQLVLKNDKSLKWDGYKII
jgi:ABC-type phosphate/phosphonate transport system substrate-binding protein